MQITMVVLDGDGEALYRAWKEELLPVAAAKAHEYGWTRSYVARSEEQLVVFNLWDTTEGLDEAFADKDIDRVQREALVPLAAGPPMVLRLDLVENVAF